MPVKIGTLIGELLAKAGVDTTKPEYAGALSIATEIPDEGGTALNTNLLTIDSAKHNSTLKSHFHAQALGSVDSNMDDLMNELEFDDTLKQELKQEKTSFKRMVNLVRKVKELEEKKATAKFSDKKALSDEIAKLNKQIADEKEASKTALKAEQDKLNAAILEYAIDASFESKQFANEGAPKKVNVLTAKNLLAEDLKSKKIKIIRTDDNTLKLVQADNPEQDYYLENKPVSYADYVDKLLGTNKMLKVTDPKQTGNQKQTIITSQDGKKDVSKITSDIDAQLEKFATSNGVN